MIAAVTAKDKPKAVEPVAKPNATHSPSTSIVALPALASPRTQP